MLKVVVKVFVLLMLEQFVKHYSRLECLLRYNVAMFLLVTRSFLNPHTAGSLFVKKVYLIQPTEAPNGATIFVHHDYS